MSNKTDNFHMPNTKLEYKSAHKDIRVLKFPEKLQTWFFIFLTAAVSQIVSLRADTPAAVSFSQPRIYPTAGIIMSVAVGDLNNDTNLDLVVATETSSVSVLLGNGMGSFQNPYSVEVGKFSTSVRIADFNADGKQDLVVLDFLTPDPDPLLYPSQGSLWIVLGKGDGTFEQPVRYDAGAYCSSVAVADLNGDGTLDLVVSSIAAIRGLYYPGDIIVLLGNGDGTFRYGSQNGVGTNPQFVSITDFDADGKFDVAVANSIDRTVTILPGIGDGTFGSGTDYSSGGGATSIAVGDFNRDAVPDLAVLNYNTADVAILLGKGNGTFFTSTNYPAGVNNCFSVAVSDFNNDHVLDLVVADLTGGCVSVLQGHGDGSFISPVPLCVGANIQSVGVGDFNKDGRPDIVAGGYSSTLIFLNTTGDPRLEVVRDGAFVTLSWPFPSTGFNLEYVTNFLSTNWLRVIDEPTTNQGCWRVSVRPTEATRFFRLRKQ